MAAGMDPKLALRKILKNIMKKLEIKESNREKIANDLIEELSFRVALIKPNDPDMRMLLGLACQQKADILDKKVLNATLDLNGLLDGSVEFSKEDREFLSMELKEMVKDTLKLKFKGQNLSKEALEEKLALTMNALAQPNHNNTLAALQKFALARFAKKLSTFLYEKNGDAKIDDSTLQAQMRDFSERYGGCSKIPGGVPIVVLGIVGNRNNFIDLEHNPSGTSFQSKVGNPSAGEGDYLATLSLSMAANLLDGVIGSTAEASFSNDTAPRPFSTRPSGPGGTKTTGEG